MRMAVMWLASAALHARPDDPVAGELFTFDDADVVEVYDSDDFRLHFTRAGRHAIDINDNNEDGTPDRLTEIAALYESLDDSYAAAGFQRPVLDDNDGGDDRFDVYLVDFGGNADGAYVRERCSPQGEGSACSGFMVQENDFAGYGYPSQSIGHRTVASHEYFHAVQAAYDAGQDAVYAEGTAVWATEQFDSSLLDLERFAGGYLRGADVPLTSGGGGPVDPFTYGAGIFFQFLTEAYGSAVVPAVIVSTSDGDWVDGLDAALLQQSSFADAFVRFCQWTLVTGDIEGDIEGFANASQMVERPLQEVELPFAPASFPVFVASSRALSMSLPAGADVVHVSITGDVPAQTDGLRLVTLSKNQNDPLAMVVHDGLTVDVDVAGATGLVVMLINSRALGSSVRPDVCIATDDSCAQPLPPPVDEERDPSAEGCGGNGAAGIVAVMALASHRRSKRSGLTSLR
jgi:hypothetical protein